MQNPFNKGRIKIASIIPPSKFFNVGCLDWGSCGLLALAGKGTIYLYKTTNNEISFLRSIEILNSNITCIKFHPELPYLAISDDCGRALLWDCESGLTIGITRQISDAQYISELEWSGRIVLGFASPNTIYSIDFWPYESEEGAKNSRILWKLDVSGSYTRMSVQKSDSFNAVLYSNGPSFTILSSKNAKTAPGSQSHSHSLGKSEKITEILYHPHVNNILLIMLENKVVTFNTVTKSGRNLIFDESTQAPFHKLLPSYTNDREIAIYCQDSSLSVFTANNNYEFSKSGTVKLKRDLFDINLKYLPVSAACNMTFPDRYIVFSPANALCMFVIKNQIPFVIAQNQIVPQSPTCYDFIDGMLAFGTPTGYIIFVDVISGVYTHSYYTSKTSIEKIRFMNRDILLWYSKTECGSIDIPKHRIIPIHTRLGPASDLICSEELAIFIHGKYGLGIFCNGQQRPMTLQSPIQAVAVQISRTPGTCFRGDIPNFAVLSNTGEINVFSYKLGVAPMLILKLRNSRENSKTTCLAWKGDCIVTADTDGVIMDYDFAFGTSKQTFSPFVDIDRIEFERGASGLYVHARDGKFGFSLDKVESCPFAVSSFAVTGNGLVLVSPMTDDAVKFVIARDWRSVKRITSQDILKPLKSTQVRLEEFGRHLLENPMNGTWQEALKIADIADDHGFPKDALVFRCVSRSLGGPALTAMHELFGGKEEVVNSLKMQSALYSPPDSAVAAYHCLLFKLRIGDREGAVDVLRSLSAKSEFTIVATMAASLLKGYENSELPQYCYEMLITAAVPLFAQHRFIEGCILMHLANAHLSAARYLQDNDRWEDSVEVCKLILDEESSKVEAKNLIRRAAHHFLDKGDEFTSLLLFISIRDFHPALAILLRLKFRALAFHLMMFLDKAEAIPPYDEDTSRYATQFPDLDSLRQDIIVKYDKLSKK